MSDQAEDKRDWVTYRDDIKVLDCTIRDGGLMNKHQFTDSLVKSVYDSCVDAGIHYIELGYKNSHDLFSTDDNGPWRFCDEEDLRRIVGNNPTDLKISVMADAEKCDLEKDLLPKDESVVDLVRVACYIHQIPLALEMLQFAKEQGYEVCVNLMAVSTVLEKDLEGALEVLVDSHAEAIYVVDSFGTFYGEQIRDLTTKYLSYAKPKNMGVGIHAHNNCQLAYANTIESMITGATMLDATITGLGRGAGNCPLELLLGFLHNPRFHVRPLLQCIEKEIAPLRKEITWGYDLPYMMTGMLNQHPRAAMAWMDAGKCDNIVEFYDMMYND